jgi:hypothetical protein
LDPITSNAPSDLVSLDRSALILREAQGSAQHLAFSFGSAQAGLGVLNQQVTLELRDGVEDVHG